MALEDRSTVMEKLTSLGKRKGFIFRSSEIYGGLGSTWDYGPLGVELKRAVTASWWSEIVSKREDVVGMDAAILMNPDVWKASGHVGSFQDPLVECSKCNRRFRQDHIEGDVSGWTVTNDPSLASGAWEQADPNPTVFNSRVASPGK